MHGQQPVEAMRNRTEPCLVGGLTEPWLRIAIWRDRRMTTVNHCCTTSNVVPQPQLQLQLWFECGLLR